MASKRSRQGSRAAAVATLKKAWVELVGPANCWIRNFDPVVRPRCMADSSGFLEMKVIDSMAEAAATRSDGFSMKVHDAVAVATRSRCRSRRG
jgi:hypothetical protein